MHVCLQVESDFNQLNTEKVDIIYTTWPRVSSAILQEIRERNVSLEVGSDLGKYLSIVSK